MDTAKEAIGMAGIGPDKVATIGVTNQRETIIAWEREWIKRRGSLMFVFMILNIRLDVVYEPQEYLLRPDRIYWDISQDASQRT